MSNIVLTESQKQAIKTTCHWYRQLSEKQQVFRIYGYAGVGKTTIVRYATDELGLSNVNYATLTGKAALVLRRHGLPATTIHQLIYVYRPASDAAITMQEKRLADLRLQADKSNAMQAVLLKNDMKELQRKLTEMKKPTFALNENSMLLNSDLLVLDECSMVDEEIARDLLSFGKPILLLGDPGQLPPIQGDPSGGFGNAAPDVFLTEIHRQALDSAVIRLATMARTGKHISYGSHSDVVIKAKREHLSPADYLIFDQVICGMHKTRFALNNAMRKAQGFTSPLPLSEQEKIIITRNDHTCGLLNGEFVSLHGATKKDENCFFAEIETEDNYLPVRRCYTGNFLDHVEYDKQRGQRDWRLKRSMVEADFGYVITCHKAQGSGWNKIAIVDDNWNINHMHPRWLYTAITRAEHGLMILS